MLLQVVNSGGKHGIIQRQGEIYLIAGSNSRISIYYGQAEGKAGMSFYWRGIGVGQDEWTTSLAARFKPYAQRWGSLANAWPSPATHAILIQLKAGETADLL